jgi:hypothetical protein
MSGHVHDVGLVRLLAGSMITMIGLETDDMVPVMNMRHRVVPIGKRENPEQRENRQ